MRPMNKLTRRSVLAGGAAALAAPVLAGGSTQASAQEAQQPDFRPEFHGRPVVPGVDVLAADDWDLLRGRRVGVITNPTGVLRDLTHEVDSLAAADRIDLRAVFGPEHGFRGTGQAGDAEDTTIDPRTGVTIYNAYGANVAKMIEFYQRSGVDTVVFDIQDVGARFYTYIWTMYLGMQAAVATNASFVVLDRPNPIGGYAFGPMLDPAFSSGVGRKPIVQQHGMTIGELARLFDAEFLPADAGGRLRSLEIVEVRGWRRRTLWAETGLPWVLPSPNMPTPDTALVYPGTCLFEGTVFSEGRGTTRPFELIGGPMATATRPGVDWRWAEECNAARLPGVRFREAYFTPTFSKHVGVACAGVQVHLTDPERFEAIRTAVTMIVTARRLYGSTVFAWRSDNYIDKLSGSARLRQMVDAGAGVDEVVGAWQAELAAFRRMREQYLLYR
jgi:uncharacterized protein YbbC (DUF1343 family)